MIFCIFCKKKLKTKKAYNSHSQNQNHKENEMKLRNDKQKFKNIFITNLCSFIYRYDEFKNLMDVYKVYLNNNIIRFEDVGYKNINSLALDLKDKVDIVKKDEKWFVKGFDRYTIPEKHTLKEEENSSDLDVKEIGNIDLDEYEEVECFDDIDLYKYIK
ncbi:hypothetical protein NAPIS_ORF00413 [Vairimorpha apis BRL 01]|uniref:Uncharacterized protein n=1 Tax=Vairimorpha apis BRL 01 TaxID=1037528 RepID=T0L3G1_9MICR|nr:hypothetical protein NAPIS_ORF00413 [Vairimorpha apis BRL 01]